MRIGRIYRYGIFAIMILVLMSTSLGLAQSEQNLLKNSGFEEGFRTVSGDAQPRSVANDWQPWNVPPSGNASFQNAPPKYIAASGASGVGILPRIRTGDDAQIYYSFFETHDAGVYQQLSGIQPGTEVRFSIYVYVWSSTFEDFDISEDPGDVAVRVGIDPSGGTDALSNDVVYSTPLVAYDTYRQYSVIATAESSTVTVFVRSTVGEPVQNTYIYLDDAVLASTEPSAAETATSTATATSTTNPTATSIASVTAQAATATATSTEGPTEDPSPTAEIIVTGQVPTATSFGPSATPSPTRPVGTAVPTATSAPITDEFPGQIVHTVSRGDTVSRIADLYGSSTAAIIQANGLNNNALIFVGQALIVPVRIPNPATETPSPTPLVPVTATPVLGGQNPGGSFTTVYVVQPGDTLLAIARRFNTTLSGIIALNNITNPNRVLVGQRLVVPVGQPPVVQPPATTVTPEPTPPTTYIVQPGDTLFRIALRFGVSLQALAAANNVFNYNLIFVGQTLVIPR